MELWLLAVLPALWVLGFAAYCVGVARHGLQRTAHLDKLDTGPLLPRLVVEFGYYVYRAPVRLCLRLGISADALTLAALFLTVAAAALVAQGRFGLGGWVLLLAYTCDGMDGVVARATGTSWDGGEVLDAVVDHACDLIAYLGFACYYRNDPLPLLLVGLTLAGSSVVSYVRARGEALGVDPKLGLMRRFERAVWLGGGTVLAPLVARLVEPGAPRPRFHAVIFVMAVLAVLTHVTAIWRIRFVVAGLRRLREPRGEQEADHAG